MISQASIVGPTWMRSRIWSLEGFAQVFFRRMWDSNHAFLVYLSAGLFYDHWAITTCEMLGEVRGSIRTFVYLH